MKAQETGTTNDIINGVLKFIDDNVTQNLNAEIIAKEFLVSTSWLMHKFKEYVNVSLKKYINQKKEETDMGDIVVVSPDLGGVTRARDLADRVNAPIAIIEKRRPRPGVAEVMNVIGDIKGKTCILVDDIVDTAGSLCGGAKALKEMGASRVFAACAHAVLTDPAVERIQKSVISELIITNTIPLPQEKQIDKIKVLSVAPLLGEAIMRIFHDVSVSRLFDK